ncbi:DNA repair protein RadA [Candidatus Gottesmanbacteria bacterium]|nr:DNA repair protein RadA [Candidatus Gottesmanbacteria bacterium]
MSKSTSVFVCQQCGYNAPQWLGRCPNCQSWNSLVETIEQKSRLRQGSGGQAKVKGAKPQKLSEISLKEIQRIPTGLEELDRVLGGGVVPGSVILLAGDPGIGKSTLLLQVCGKLAGLYISGEESVTQVKMRAERLGLGASKMQLMAENDTDNICIQIEEERSPIVIVDSIQTLETVDLSGMAGAVGQVRESASRLIRIAKENTIPIIIVGHVTKEGTIAGPKVLEHLVDTVLYLEGERFQSLRILRSNKNRYGPVDEVGVFEMDDRGIKEVKNPSELFLNELRSKNKEASKTGSVTVCTMEGSRPILAEIQALVIPSKLTMPRRAVTGVDFNRLQLILAVLQKKLNLPLYACDVYLNVAGGLKISEPAADLACAIAIISSYKNKPLPSKTCAIGEIGLLGELRRVGNLEKRIKEADRLGYTNIISSNQFASIVEATKTL